MKKISFFGLVIVAFMAMAIFIVSCSQPLFPQGSNYPPEGGGGNPGNEGGDIPGWNTDGSGPCGRMTVAEQLEWLRNNAAAGTEWNVWAWMEPYETIYVMQDIHGVGGPGTDIIVNLSTFTGYNRRKLALGASGSMRMLNVQGDNTLILENIVLQGRFSNFESLVAVHAGTLEKRSNSKIRENGGPIGGAAVSITAGASFTMSGNALITEIFPTAVVVTTDSVLEMRDTASITHDRNEANYHGVRLENNSTLIMRNSTHISGHRQGGLLSSMSTIRMYDSAEIMYNNASGSPFNWNVYLTDSDLIMRGNVQIRDSDTGGVHLRRSRLCMHNTARIHSNNDEGVRALESSTVNMYNTARIHSNNGGGVRALGSSTINMRNDASIDDNGDPTSGIGIGGVLLNDSRLYMHHDAVRIKGNFSASEGGGVRLANNSALIIHGGLILGDNHPNPAEGNQATGDGNALYIAGGSVSYGPPPFPAFNVSGGSPTLPKDNTVGYLGSGLIF